MAVQNMEIGNLLFGHSRGEYRLDRYSAEADRLGNVLYELGLNSYGYQDSDLDRVVDHNPHLQVTWLKEHPEGNDLRRVDVVDPNTGEILMIVRKYWWGDYDTPEDKASADAPNLEVPKLDLQMDWYKYYGRDSRSPPMRSSGLRARPWRITNQPTTDHWRPSSIGTTKLSMRRMKTVPTIVTSKSVDGRQSSSIIPGVRRYATLTPVKMPRNGWRGTSEPVGSILMGPLQTTAANLR